MTYSCNDQSDRLIELLKKSGYSLVEGNGFECRVYSEREDEYPEPTDVGTYNREIDGVWFNWAPTSGGSLTHVGETCEDAMTAWSSAMEHFFANAKKESATPEEIEHAREFAGNDVVQIDDDAEVSRYHGGHWIQAWVDMGA